MKNGRGTPAVAACFSITLILFVNPIAAVASGRVVGGEEVSETSAYAFYGFLAYELVGTIILCVVPNRRKKKIGHVLYLTLLVSGSHGFSIPF